jgi:hypothetical protein
LINEAIAVLFHCARAFGRSPGARAVDETLRAVAGKAMAPLAQRGIGKLERIRDGLQALAFHDVAHRLGTADNAGVFGLLAEGV